MALKRAVEWNKIPRLCRTGTSERTAITGSTSLTPSNSPDGSVGRNRKSSQSSIGVEDGDSLFTSHLSTTLPPCAKFIAFLVIPIIFFKLSTLLRTDAAFSLKVSMACSIPLAAPQILSVCSSNVRKYGSQSKVFAIVELHENSVQIRIVSLLLYQLGGLTYFRLSVNQFPCINNES